jgi:tubulin--tyrosine ligase
VALVDAMCRANANNFEVTGEIATHWIVKSSHGAHGSNIKIFYATQEGLDNLIDFIDGQEEPYPWVVSRYIDRPLLYEGRKFDVRVWALITSTWRIYIHRELVMRTSSHVYTRSNCTTDNEEGRLANITNHCVQAESRLYSTFEVGNELWRDTLDGLIRQRGESMDANILPNSRTAGGWRNSPRPGSNSSSRSSTSSSKPHESKDVPAPRTRSCAKTLENWVAPQIKQIIIDTIQAARRQLPVKDPNVLTNSFQLMGYDFIIDDSLHVWLLEINGSPGVADRLLSRIVRDFVEVVLDPIFPSPGRQRRSSPNGFELAYEPFSEA